MTAEQAARLCKFGVALRLRQSNRPEYVIPRTGITFSDQSGFWRTRPGNWRAIAPQYADGLTDWEPAFPRDDVVTRLALIDLLGAG